MSEYEAKLKEHLQAVVDGSRSAQNAMEEAARYWRQASPKVANTESPDPLIGALEEIAKKLDGLATRISKQLGHSDTEAHR